MFRYAIILSTKCLSLSPFKAHGVHTGPNTEAHSEAHSEAHTGAHTETHSGVC